MKNQECKYGCTCKNNHPEMAAPQAHPNMVPLQKPMGGAGFGGKGAGKGGVSAPPAGMNSKGYPIRPGATACSFFLKTGTCKFEATCQFTHPEGVDAASVAVNPLQAQGIYTAPAESFNSKGYPLRPGQPICAFFAKTGECKFSNTCKFDHTEGMGFEDAGQTLTNSLGHPVRPGQPACAFFVKNGTCSYSGTCKFDHPEEYTVLGAATGGVAPKPQSRAAATSFNSQGLPLRPGAEPCTFFLKTGSCSYGATCKWDHPEGLGGSQPGFQKAGGVAGPNMMMRASPY